MVTIGKNILDTSETEFSNFPPYVFDVVYVAKSDLGYLSVIDYHSSQEKNTINNYRSKKVFCSTFLPNFFCLATKVKIRATVSAKGCTTNA